MSLAAIISAELRAMARDRWLLAMLSWLPLTLLGLILLIFSQQIPRELVLGVVDLDRSTISRALVRDYGASPTLLIDDHFADIETGRSALTTGAISALAVLPAELGRDVILGRPVQVTVFVNDQFLLMGKIINSALLQAHGTFNGRLESGRSLVADTPVIEMAISRASPTASQVTPLFNLGINYAQFLVSAILPALWQIVMVAATIMALIALRRDTPDLSGQQKSPSAAIMARLLSLSLLFWLQGILFLTLISVWLGWPMHGSWPLLLFAQLLTVWASMGAATLLYSLSSQRAETALSLAASFVAPGLAFMGVTFPVTDMTLPARLWRSLIPISHYVEVQFGQVNYGAAAHTALPQLLALCLFAIPLAVGLLLAQRAALRHAQGVTS